MENLKYPKKEILKAIYTVFRLTIFRMIIKKDIHYYNLVENEFSLLNPIKYLSFILHTGRYLKISKIIKEGNLLDIGCGRPSDFMSDGAFLKFIDREDSVGIDLNELNLTKYKFIKANAMNIPFADKYFDNIVAMEILEHIEEIGKAMIEIKRIMKDDGILIISTPNNSILWKLIWFIWSNTFGKMWQHKHVIEYTETEWAQNISKHFKIETIHHHFFFDLIIKCRKI